ncbi:MAG: DUF3089 domain-containing protein [Solirubrobacteraceae bacterium]|nr:DUF3089 domain-containing protein [Solirubrobacteraceae bacterium]
MFGLSRRTAMALLAVVAFLFAAPSAPAAPTVEPTKVPARWGCYPGMAESICAQAYVTTVLGNTQIQRRRVLGTTRTEVSADPPIDCFYVYPTVTSDGFSSNAQRRINADVRTVLRQQAAAFTPACRVFAPIYRQESAGSIAGAYVTQQRGPTPPQDIAYADVLGAWNEYMARDNHGRGVLLIGHSQGSAILSRLLRDVIDPDPVLRGQLVGAILPGSAFTTARGELVGGTTQHIPLCTQQGQDGCVVAYSTYGRRPGRDPLFAALGALVRAFGGPTGPEYELACTNPAELAGDGDILHPLLSGRPAPGWSGIVERAFWNFLRPEASTPWVVTTDRFTASCERDTGTAVLRVRAGRNSIMPSPVPWAEWGLHSGEVSMTLGSLIEIAHHMGSTYVSEHGRTTVSPG